MAELRSKLDNQIRPSSTAHTKTVGLKWDEDTTFNGKTTWVARNADGFTVSILKQVCHRKNCMEEASHLYVWHHAAKAPQDRAATLKSDGAWFIRDGWKDIAEESSAEGVKWLQEMMIEQ